MAVLLAVISMLIRHTLLNYVLRYTEAIPVTVSIIGKAVGAAIFASIVLRQTLLTFTRNCWRRKERGGRGDK